MKHSDPNREFLRHTLATLVYRAEKPLRKAPPRFGSMRVAPDTRSASQILAHLCDLLDWAFQMASNRHIWRPQKPAPWNADVARFYKAAKRLDEYLASGKPLRAALEKLFQGPIADALTHVGQLATLRRLAGSPVRGENYFRAAIVKGRVGPKQSAERVEFD
jgi:hypothetical protein